MDHWYVGVDAGLALTPVTRLGNAKTEYNTGWDAGFEVGYRSGTLRFEAEYLYQRANIEKIAGIDVSGLVRTSAAMGNILYDFGEVGSVYNPFIGCGIGYGYVKHSQRSHDSVFAYQVTFGVGFNIVDDTTFTLGYRYFGTTKASNSLGDRYQDHLLNVGLVYFME